MPISKVLDAKTRKQIFGDNWPIRRRWMKWSLFYLSSNVEIIIGWTIYAGGNAFGTQIAMSLLAAAISILMFYIFGAVYDDHSKRRFLGGYGGDNDDSSSETEATDERPEHVPAGDR